MQLIAALPLRQWRRICHSFNQPPGDREPDFQQRRERLAMREIIAAAQDIVFGVPVCAAESRC
jgi:hypothetical protein